MLKKRFFCGKDEKLLKYRFFFAEKTKTGGNAGFLNLICTLCDVSYFISCGCPDFYFMRLKFLIICSNFAAIFIIF